MFGSHEKTVSKKTFQKPNILRRKFQSHFPRANNSNVSLTNEVKCLLSTTEGLNSKDSSTTQNVNKAKHDSHFKHTVINDATQILNINQPILKLKLDNCHKKNVKPQETENNYSINNDTLTNNAIDSDSFGKNHGHNSLNIESFMNTTSALKPELIVSITNSSLSPERKIAEAKINCTLDFPDDSMDDINNVTGVEETDKEPDFITNVLSSTITANQNPLQIICTSTPTRAVSVELFSNRAVKFKCDEPNCNKGFWSEDKLIKHKNSHNKQSSVRPQGQITIECPVKKEHGDGVEEKCPYTFQVRRDLLKHLNADHSPEDAPHKCEVCGRRFFWASGLRAHAQSQCARGGLACAWPGCNRVFRLPCRLREHARAHTGDRPYLCHYPECGWAFRSASKLVRHARRHTDERRHACASCGRAFLRREHLREHARRHHPRAQHACAHPGCEQSFTNMSTLYMHMKKVHKKAEDEQITLSVVNQPSNAEITSENIYMEEESYNGGDCHNVAEWHAARTHCTWPLTSHHHHREQDHDLTLVLEEDVQVENAEGSSNNVYTVRSDLFLHGNVLIDDDSQNMVAGEIVEREETVVPLDTDLCLTDSHPTIDLMQEGLMYEDAVVDESSFRVFL